MTRWRLRWGVLLWLCFPAAALAQPVVDLPPLYQQVAGGEEDYVVPSGTTLNRLALEKGVQWQVVARLNGLEKPYRLKAGMVLKIDTTHIVPAELRHGLVINLPELMLYYFQDGLYVRRYSLAVGRRSWPTPTGDYSIRNKTRNPTWVVPASIQEEMEEMGQEVLERVPPGPENPLGAYWLGTSAPGVGIHATNRPWSVGLSVSHGCIRMLPEEIAQLFPRVEVETPLKIVYRPIKLALTPEGRIFLEAHPNIYRWRYDARALVEEWAQHNRLVGRIDWEKVPAVLKAREGVARDITLRAGRRAPAIPGAAAHTRETRLSPLQGQKAAVE
jgi:L,D-transpeptidase ErfK/SrfK